MPPAARLSRREALLPLLAILEIGLVFGSAIGTAFVPSSVANNGELVHLMFTGMSIASVAAAPPASFWCSSPPCAHSSWSTSYLSTMWIVSPSLILVLNVTCHEAHS